LTLPPALKKVWPILVGQIVIVMLGASVAAAVETALKVYGATDAQMEAVSWGREKPKATGHDESSWEQNGVLTWSNRYAAP